MKIWLIESPQKTPYPDYDVYLGAVVVAETAAEAARTHPGEAEWDGRRTSEWAEVAAVRVSLVGEAFPGTGPGVILASYRAG